VDLFNRGAEVAMTVRTRMSWLRPITTRLFNPLARRFAGWLPGFGILTYRGRTSGRIYHTPLNVFRRGQTYVFALTYGADTQWVKNVLVAGSCTLRTRGHDLALVDPELIHDPSRSLMPRPVRAMLGLDNVADFLRMRIA
jgi:deazaflavin-dependent oxidoreductase (nitroreductase family)